MYIYILTTGDKHRTEKTSNFFKENNIEVHFFNKYPHGDKKTLEEWIFLLESKGWKWKFSKGYLEKTHFHRRCISNYLNMIAILEDAIKEKRTNYLVLEDDVIIEDIDAILKLDIPEECDILSLYQIKPKKGIVGITKSLSFWGVQGVIYKNPKKTLDILKSIEKVNNYDCVISRLRARLNIYVTYPYLVKPYKTISTVWVD